MSSHQLLNWTRWDQELFIKRKKKGKPKLLLYSQPRSNLHFFLIPPLSCRLPQHQQWWLWATSLAQDFPSPFAHLISSHGNWGGGKCFHYSHAYFMTV